MIIRFWKWHLWFRKPLKIIRADPPGIVALECQDDMEDWFGPPYVKSGIIAYEKDITQIIPMPEGTASVVFQRHEGGGGGKP